MEPTAPHVYIPPLGHHQHDEVGRELQATLVELTALSLIGKQLHWSVSGPLFRPLHEQLDELVESWRELADAVAERAVTVGFWPDGQASAVAAESELGEIERGAVHDHRVIAVLTHRVAETAERVRTRMDRLGELDLASQDVLVDVLRALEEQQWMLRAQLPVDSAR